MIVEIEFMLLAWCACEKVCNEAGIQCNVIGNCNESEVKPTNKKKISMVITGEGT